MLTITPIPAFNDNYIWLIIHTRSNTCLIVDPGDAKPVLAALKAHKLDPTAILLTHHHHDHTGGVADLRKVYSIPVYGAAIENIATVTHPLQGSEVLTFPSLDLILDVLSIPGHTQGHTAYYGGGALFPGDTLFTGGCGRVFEGTMIQMYSSLQRLAALPPDTHVYCGHEYTVANLSFASVVEPDNVRLQQRVVETQSLRARKMPTVPSTLALEKATNPFLRCDQPSVRLAAESQCGSQLDKPEKVFAVLREWKNRF